MNLIDTSVRNLLPGDALFGSGQTVKEVYPVRRERSTGRYTRTLVVCHPRRGDRVVRWNASTTMRVERG